MELLGNFVPWHKLLRRFIDQILLGRVLTGGVHVEADHAADEAHADLFFPSVFWASQGHLDGGDLLPRGQLKLHVVLGVVDPRELVYLLFELLVVEVAAAGRFLGPLARMHDILRVLQLLDFHGLRRVNVQGEVGRRLILEHRRDYDEGTLRRLVEGVEGRHIVRTVVGLFVPLTWQ